ncbi:MAG TPA: tol-pal system-associated acyl-CoA thioesterase [Halothiobacillaceae bacterium]|nr:tol-pal system-associated acyl-CoA thioesterase [Halothiobacillaceae bacterium]
MLDQSPTLPFVWPVRVYYEDTDAGGVVYHSRYLNFMERARTEWLRAAGIEQDQLRKQQGLIFAVSKAALEYRAPARFNEQLLVEISAVSARRVTMNLQQKIINAADQRLLCLAEIQIACVDSRQLRPRAIPQYVLELV